MYLSITVSNARQEELEYRSYTLQTEDYGMSAVLSDSNRSLRFLNGIQVLLLFTFKFCKFLVKLCELFSSVCDLRAEVV